MTMPKRRLGTAGPELSVFGLGSWAIGGGDWRYGLGPQDDRTSIATIVHAVEGGVNWIDTAASYGLGHAEVVIGRALRQLAPDQRPYVFTKCGVLWDKDRPYDEPRRVLRPDTIRVEVEASLRRLGVERIDVYQIHWPPEDESTPLESSWAEMARLVEGGTVGAIGVSNFSVDQLERCQRIHQVASVQVPLSLIHRSAADGLIPYASRIGAGAVVYSPLQTGLLTERWSRDRIASLPRGDRRLWHEDFQSPNLERNLALRDALQPLAERHGRSVGALALAWTLGWPGVTSAIHGARSTEQLDVAFEAADLRLDDEDLDAIAVVIDRAGAGEGPSRPSLRA
jgi:aryl-alcohol dehydrogenase-like predicted oxidoreductase